MRAKVTIGIVIAAGILLLVFLSSGGGEESVYYYTPSEILAQKEVWPNRLRLRGVVTPGTIAVSKAGIDLCMEVQDEADTLHVRYHGTVPEALREGLEVVVDGRIREALFLRDARPAPADSDMEGQVVGVPAAGADPDPGRPTRLEGTVDPASLRIVRGESEAAWLALGGGGDIVHVRVQGPARDLPRPGERVAYEGRLEKGLLFEGSELIVKCPSKYEPATGGDTAGRPAEAL